MFDFKLNYIKIIYSLQIQFASDENQLLTQN